MDRDVEVTARIPDLASGSVALEDVLVAIEFLRTRWCTLVDQRYGRFLALNLRELSQEVWASHPGLSLQRGIAAIRMPVPVWVLQLAGQGVSSWALPGDPPILTEHLEGQFAWMAEIYPEAAAQRSLYQPIPASRSPQPCAACSAPRREPHGVPRRSRSPRVETRARMKLNAHCHVVAEFG
jgi:hypothetical protein